VYPEVTSANPPVLTVASLLMDAHVRNMGLVLNALSSKNVRSVIQAWNVWTSLPQKLVAATSSLKPINAHIVIPTINVILVIEILIVVGVIHHLNA